jgi:hypothetical protein
MTKEELQKELDGILLMFGTAIVNKAQWLSSELQRLSSELQKIKAKEQRECLENQDKSQNTK